MRRKKLYYARWWSSAKFSVAIISQYVSYCISHMYSYVKLCYIPWTDYNIMYQLYISIKLETATTVKMVLAVTVSVSRLKTYSNNVLLIKS